MKKDERFYDVVIVGGGPAGLSAAIYAARARYKVLVLEKESIGGQITITEEVVNYPGIPSISGRELTEKMRRQAESFGAEFVMAQVQEMELERDVKILHTTRGEYKTLGILLAPGANPRKLGFLGEKEFQGRGVAYCATCDGEFFTGKEVFVIGGGYAAVEEGIFLTKYARKVTIVVRKQEFSCARSVSDKLKGQKKIRVLFRTELLEAGGDQGLTYARFHNNETGEEWRYEASPGETFGIFVFAGYVPNTAWISDAVEKDSQGYLLTDRDQKTSVDGVYAAGDVCVKNLRQVVTAVSDGAIAATALEKVVSALHEKLKLPPLEMNKHPDVSKGNTETSAEQRKDPLSRGEDGSETVRQKTEETAPGGFLSPQIREQLEGVFSRFRHRVQLRLWADDSTLSGEMEEFLGELTGLTDLLSWEKCSNGDFADAGKGKQPLPEGMSLRAPVIELCREDGSSSGIFFHGVPGGHEFNSFVIGLYNVAGPGQSIDGEMERALREIPGPVNVKILVSLSCTMCPETVMAAGKAASLNEGITAEMFDLAHFPELKEKYQVMSVPCTVINDEKVIFGKKNLTQLTEILCGE